MFYCINVIERENELDAATPDLKARKEPLFEKCFCVPQKVTSKIQANEEQLKWIVKTFYLLITILWTTLIIQNIINIIT